MIEAPRAVPGADAPAHFSFAEGQSAGNSLPELPPVAFEPQPLHIQVGSKLGLAEHVGYPVDQLTDQLLDPDPGNARSSVRDYVKGVKRSISEEHKGIASQVAQRQLIDFLWAVSPQNPYNVNQYSQEQVSQIGSSTRAWVGIMMETFNDGYSGIGLENDDALNHYLEVSTQIRGERQSDSTAVQPH